VVSVNDLGAIAFHQRWFEYLKLLGDFDHFRCGFFDYCSGNLRLNTLELVVDGVHRDAQFAIDVGSVDGGLNFQDHFTHHVRDGRERQFAIDLTYTVLDENRVETFLRKCIGNEHASHDRHGLLLFKLLEHFVNKCHRFSLLQKWLHPTKNSDPEDKVNESIC
jgi:hypothetical protein